MTPWLIPQSTVICNCTGVREENPECGISLCVSLFFIKVQSHGAVIRATGEERFEGNRSNELISHQQLSSAGLHPALALACAVAVCLFSCAMPGFLCMRKALLLLSSNKVHDLCK